MPEIYNFSEHEILAFFLVLVRLSSFIVTWPVFGVSTIPQPIKILLALSLSFVVFPIVEWTQVKTELTSMTIVWLFAREMFIGISLGFLARLFFFTFNIAGSIISVSMGISSGQLFNPALGDQSSAIEQFILIVATLFFLAINGHHLFLMGIIDSFRLLPLTIDPLSFNGLSNMGVIVHEIMTLGVRICAPVMVAILFMNLTMAVIGRAVPQINVLITSLPVNIMVGYIVLIVTIPVVIWQMHDLLELTTYRVFQILKSY